MKSMRIVIVTVVSMVMLFATVALAQEHGSRDEAKALADAAVEHVKKVGVEQAFKDFSNDKATWTKKDLFVIGYDMKGNCLANGWNDKLIGKNLMDLKDPNGVMITAELTKTAQTKGQGWVDYIFQHPQTKKLAEKSTWVRKLPNFDGWVAVGIYR